MQIEAGKRYVRRDGSVSGVIRYKAGGVYPFFCPVNIQSYTEKGQRYLGATDHSDLVAEYVEPVSPSEVSGNESAVAAVEYDLSGIPAGYEFVGYRQVVEGDLFVAADTESVVTAGGGHAKQALKRAIVKPIESKQRTVVIHKWLVWDALGKERMVFGTEKYIGDCGFSDAVDLGVYEEVKVNV